MTDQTNTYFIGYDPRVPHAARTAAYSLMTHMRKPGDVYFVDPLGLILSGRFKRGILFSAKGDMTDQKRGSTMKLATDYIRFAMPHLASELGCTGPCLFLDFTMLAAGIVDAPGEIMDAMQNDTPGIASDDFSIYAFMPKNDPEMLERAETATVNMNRKAHRKAGVAPMSEYVTIAAYDDIDGDFLDNVGVSFLDVSKRVNANRGGHLGISCRPADLDKDWYHGLSEKANNLDFYTLKLL